ncbi:glycoside hydrolase superfamily, partial [Mycena rosella]
WLSSLCDLFNSPDAVRQNLSTLLFSPAGLGLSNFRFNIGGGGVGVTNPVRAPATFYVSPGVYNFSADPQGVYFMQQASAHGVPSITAFVNSAPPQLTSNRQSCGGSFVNGTGLAYGTYVADVISRWRLTGLMIDFISPMNEPDDSFGTCGQEGMQVSANQYLALSLHRHRHARAHILAGERNALQTNGLSTTVGILADESSSLSLATAEYSTWLPSVASKVVAIVRHTYDFPTDASYTSFVNTVKAIAPGKATWMSEICCSLGTAAGVGRGYTQGFDQTITNALMFSGLVFQILVLASEPHYDFWTLVSNGLGCSPVNNPSCPRDGMIYYDPSYATNKNFVLSRMTHITASFKHFGNFVRRECRTGFIYPYSSSLSLAGSVRHALTGSNVQQWMMAVANQLIISSP